MITREAWIKDWQILIEKEAITAQTIHSSSWWFRKGWEAAKKGGS